MGFILYVCRNIVAPARKDSEMEDVMELEILEPRLESAMEVEDITTLDSIHEQASCCVDRTEDAPAPVAPKPKLVIGLGQTDADHLESSGDALALDKDDDFMNLDDGVAKLSSPNRSTSDAVVGPSILG